MDTKTQHLLRQINEAFKGIVHDMKPLYYVMPLNDAEEKQKFLSGDIANPYFVYRDFEYDPLEKLRALTDIEASSSDFKEAVRIRRERIEQKLKLLVDRGHPVRVQSLSREIYGAPTEDLVEAARNILIELASEPEELTVSAEEIQQAIEAAYDRYGLVGWRVELEDKWMTTVYHFDNKITICKNRRFTENDKARLVAHEVGVHVLRHMNHHMQQEEVLEVLFVNEYLSTEEGLASYAEEVTGTATVNSKRDYAGRVLAIDAMLNGSEFRETFSMLKECGFDDDRAWAICVRSYRGGGLSRDIAYLKGYFEVKDYVEKGGDIKLLYTAKVDLSQINLVKEYLKSGILNEPQFVPEFFASN